MSKAVVAVYLKTAVQSAAASGGREIATLQPSLFFADVGYRPV